MKSWIVLFVLLLIFLFVGIFIGKGCEGDEPLDYSGRISELERDTTRSGIIRDSLTALIDSLETIPPKIEKQIVIREREIDENIAKDSSASIVEFRKALQDNNELPDKAEYPTYREFGLSAKLMAKVPKLELKINLYEKETIPTLKADVKNYSDLYDASKDLNKIKDLNLEQKDEQIDDLNAWYNNKFLWMGLGVLATGATVYLVK